MSDDSPERAKAESSIRQDYLTRQLQKTISEVDEKLGDTYTPAEIMLTLLKMVTGYQVRIVDEELGSAERMIITNYPKDHS